MTTATLLGLLLAGLLTMLGNNPIPDEVLTRKLLRVASVWVVIVVTATLIGRIFS